MIPADYDPNSNWEASIDDFTAGIKENVHPDVHPLIDTTFSTTTSIEKTIMHISVMDITKSYFEFSLLCGCGIPWIELKGKKYPPLS
jgi:hypothetical protein